MAVCDSHRQNTWFVLSALMLVVMTRYYFLAKVLLNYIRNKKKIIQQLNRKISQSRIIIHKISFFSAITYWTYRSSPFIQYYLTNIYQKFLAHFCIFQYEGRVILNEFKYIFVNRWLMTIKRVILWKLQFLVIHSYYAASSWQLLWIPLIYYVNVCRCKSIFHLIIHIYDHTKNTWNEH